MTQKIGCFWVSQSGSSVCRVFGQQISLKSLQGGKVPTITATASCSGLQAAGSSCGSRLAHRQHNNKVNNCTSLRYAGGGGEQGVAVLPTAILCIIRKVLSSVLVLFHLFLHICLHLSSHLCCHSLTPPPHPSPRYISSFNLSLCRNV